MPLRLTLTRYDDITANPNAAVSWTTVHHGLSSLQALTLVGQAVSGPQGEWTGYEVIHEITGRRLHCDQLARVAYLRAHHGPEHREQFARWVASALDAHLWPWDDLVTISDPPDSYVLSAASWFTRVLGDEIESWLAQLLAEQHDLDLPAIVHEPSTYWRCPTLSPRL